jgi:peptidyl-prolyl cis-trans isomerase D
MITWMQRHRKYLVITIWISTIAFIGAGFVGWGQYRYGEKSGAVAKVGDVTITGEELQKSYSRLFNRYAQIFKGQFDQEQAKKFGLDKQALQQLINEALLINLANGYNLQATDKEVAALVEQEKAFRENGVFSKALYTKVLKQNGMTPVQYESGLRKSILIQKLFKLFPVEADKLEMEAFETALGIADRIEYKVLDGSNISIDTSDAALKTFWTSNKSKYMTAQAFKIDYIEQPNVSSGATEDKVKAYYDANKYSFVGPDGKILDFKTAKKAVIAAMDDKATNKAALRTYIAYKKDKLGDDVKVEKTTVTMNDGKFSKATMQAIASADLTKPYLKPVKEGGRYIIIKIEQSIRPEVKSFEAAKADVLRDYGKQMRMQKLLAIAQSSVGTFKGRTTAEYLKRTDTKAITGLDSDESAELLATVFKSNKASGYAGLQSGKIVLYRVVDQKIETAKDAVGKEAVVQAKTALFNHGLITSLAKRYETKIFLKGYGQ